MAGLHAAFKLGEIGIRDVVILEALDRIGGRIHTIPVNGDVVELGAQWIHGQGENPLWKFVQEKQVKQSYLSLLIDTIFLVVFVFAVVVVVVLVLETNTKLTEENQVRDSKLSFNDDKLVVVVVIFIVGGYLNLLLLLLKY